MVSKKQIEVLIWILLTAVLIAVAIMAAVPPVSRDALTHHLAVPKLYLLAGGIYEIPEIEFSYYPMNLDLLYMIPLYFGNDILPKYIHFAFGLLTALMIYCFLRERTEHRLWAALGALLFLTLPVIVKLSITVYVDLGLVFFSTAALIYVMKWALGGGRRRHLVYAAVCCGLCLGTKYNGLIAFFLLTCSVPILYLRWHLNRNALPVKSGVDPDPVHPFRTALTVRAVGAALIFVAISLAVFSPWMIRNYKWTGNPVYPLYQSVFGLKENDSAHKDGLSLPKEGQPEKKGGRLSHFVIRKRVFNETLLEALSTPVRIFFQGQDDNPRYFDGRLNPYLFVFPLFAFIGFASMARQRKIENLTLALFAVLFLLYAFFKVDMRIRYIAPIIPPLVILAVFGAENIYNRLKAALAGPKKLVGIGVLIVSLVALIGSNMVYLVDQFDYVAPLEYLSGKIERDAYIQKYRGEYDAIRFINRNLPSDARVLAVYLGNRIYYSDRTIISNDSIIVSAIESATTSESLCAQFESDGFTHLLIRNEFFRRFILERLTPEKRSMAVIFFRERTNKLFSKNGYSVIELKVGRISGFLQGQPAQTRGS